MITLRSKIFIITSLIVFLFLAISITLYVISKKKTPAEVDQPNNSTPAEVDQEALIESVRPVTSPITTGLTVKQPTSEEAIKLFAKQTAKIFAERYGTYSTDNPGVNIIELQPMVTDQLWSVLNKNISTKPSAVFYGATTRVVSVSIVEYSDTAAKVETAAQRDMTKDKTTETVAAKMTVTLIRDGDKWLVDGFEWGK